MRVFTTLTIALFIFTGSMWAQTKTTPAPSTTKPAAKPATTPAAPAKTTTTTPAKGAPAKPAATAPAAGAKSSGGVDIYKFDKEQKDYNYSDREQISKPLMPSYEYMQPFHEKGAKRKKQQEAYLAQKYYYPAKPKNKWELGLGAGISLLMGDVNTKMNILDNSGFHFQVRKALSYFFSVRGMYTYNTTTGRKWLFDYQSAGLYSSTSGSDIRNGRLDLTNVNFGNIIPSYQTYYHTLNADLILTLGNTRFHKERAKSTFDFFVGAAGIMYLCKIDVLDANRNGYMHTEANDLMNTAPTKFPNDVNAIYQVKGEIIDALDRSFDGTYESYGDVPTDLPRFMGYSILPALTGGAGYNYRLSKMFTLGLVSRFTYANTDYLDGQIYNGNATVINGNLIGNKSSGGDLLTYTALNVGIMVGGKKAIEPLYWQNPIHHSNYKMGQMDPSKIINDAFKDDDNDGVPNQLDKEENTKKGFPVDVKGVALDSDKDGLKDGEDKEPYSLPSLPVDEYGVAIVPPPACCAMLDSMGRNGVGGVGGSGGMGGGIGAGAACSEITLPSLMFDQNKYGVNNRDFIPILHIVGEKMQMCPDAKIVVSGINDKSSPNGKVNEQLSYNRANETINFLTEKYGISRDRFIMKYNQDGSGNKAKDRKVDFRFAKEGETGDGNPPAPHPGLKAGVNE